MLQLQTGLFSESLPSAVCSSCSFRTAFCNNYVGIGAKVLPQRYAAPDACHVHREQPVAEKTRHNSLDHPAVQKQVIGVQVVEQERVSKRGVTATDDTAFFSFFLFFHQFFVIRLLERYLFAAKTMCETLFLGARSQLKTVFCSIFVTRPVLSGRGRSEGVPCIMSIVLFF